MTDLLTLDLHRVTYTKPPTDPYQRLSRQNRKMPTDTDARKRPAVDLRLRNSASREIELIVTLQATRRAASITPMTDESASATFSSLPRTVTRTIRLVRVSARKYKEMHYLKRSDQCNNDDAVFDSLHRYRHSHKQLSPTVRLASWVYPFTDKRFHVLLNSLFKVLCNFPSRYLFAIGLIVIFSLRWSLPPTLGCTLKQPDSIMQRLVQRYRPVMGLAPAMGLSPSQRDLQNENIGKTPKHTRCTSRSPFDDGT